MIRPIRPEDAEPIRASFSLLQPEEVRQRFSSGIQRDALAEMTPEAAERMTRINPKNEFALVAAEPLPPGEALIGAVARISVDDNGRDAGFAILVSHYVANMGLGRYLMTRLVKWARGKKLDCVYGDVFEHNQAMLSLAESLGFERSGEDAAGLIRVRLDLKPKAA